MNELPLPSRPANTTDSANDLLLALVRLHEAGKVAIELDFKRLNHMDSPVGVEADSNLWAYAVLALTLIAWWRGGWEIALAVAAVGVVIYYTVGRTYVRRRLERRVIEKALGNLDTWRKLWRFGGIALVPRDGEPCVAPEGNWMALVRGLGVTSPER